MRGEIHRTDKRCSHPIEMIKSALIYLNDCTNTNQAVLLRCFLPYLFLAMGNDKFLPLNRNYKPLGLLNGEWVEYKEFSHLFIDKSEFINFDEMKKEAGFRSDETYFLFNDGTSPFGYKKEREIYIQKLTNLFDFGPMR